jgi:hypothetical protein
MIYKEGHSSYGHCWIEGDGINFWYTACQKVELIKG